MKKAFTMIELVFVIIILGILAAVAIPKLTATRDDAEVATGVQRVRNMITDLGSYYTAHGKFAEVEKMTDQELMKTDLSTFTGTLEGKTAYFGNSAKTKKCLSVTIDDANGTLTLADANDPSSYCKTLIKELGPMVKTYRFAGSNIYQ